MEEGKKETEGKTRYDLIAFSALDELAKVYTFGCQKYEDRNWQKGIKFSKIIGSLFRHTTAWIMGETINPESGLHHLAHAAFWCFAIIFFQKEGREDLNDMQMKKESKTNTPIINIDYFTGGIIPPIIKTEDMKWFTFQNKK